MVIKNQYSACPGKVDQAGDVTVNHTKDKERKEEAVLEYHVPLVFKSWQDWV